MTVLIVASCSQSLHEVFATTLVLDDELLSPPLYALSNEMTCVSLYIYRVVITTAVREEIEIILSTSHF